MSRALLNDREMITVPLPQPDSEQAEPTHLAFYTKTNHTWDALYADCAAAKESIAFEQYLFEDDTVGHRFLELFRDKARQGISVRLIFDAIGSRSAKSSPLIDEIRKAGGDVSFYNVIGWRDLFSPNKWLPRTHCKIMLIDNRIAYIGGVCIGKYMKDWHDLHARITGKLVQKMCLSPDCDQEGKGVEETEPLFEFMINQTKGEAHRIYRALLDEIDNAQKTIDLVTPYFFPPRRLRKALARASHRGVAVRIMLSQESDLPFGAFLSRSYFPSLIRRGISIILYSQDILHAKYALIDGKWAMMGSANFDYLSLVHNQEANIIIRDPETLGRLQAVFEQDAATCSPAEDKHPLLMYILKPFVKWIRQRL